MEIETYVIRNRLGLHARAAALLVKTANRFASEITLVKDGVEVNGKSIMGILMLAAAKGTKGTLKVEEEVRRFLGAIQESREQLIEIKEKILDPEVRRHSFILDVYLMILDDQMLIQDTVDRIQKKKVNAEWALDLTLEKLDT